ncbi:hypothetical protein KC320_g7044 [Hortaea werneckii]|nr:hypothetical protein KC320_g7044 [Hortaea werneckii]
MDSSRASSVYSTDSSRKPTYLDYRSGGEPYSRSASFRAAKEYAESLSGSRRGRGEGQTGVRRETAESSVSTSRDTEHSMRARGDTGGSSTASTASYTPSRGVPEIAVPSETTARPPAYAPAAPSSRQSSRQSSRPSFMNYQAPPSAVKPEPPAVAQEQTAPEPPQRKTVPKAGLLLVITAGRIHEQTKKHLEVMLKKRLYTGVAVVGLQEHEAAIKQFKMDIWGLIGKLGREMGAHAHFFPDLAEGSILRAVSAAVEGNDLGAVLCNVDYPGSAEKDLTLMARDEMLRSWNFSVGFLHSVAKPTMPLLLPGSSTNADPGLTFLLTETGASNPATVLSRAACEALFRELQTRYAEQGMTVEHADRVLIPEPEPVPEKPTANGVPPLQTNGFAQQPLDEPEFTAGESPTKLWNMWALAQEIGD